MRIERAVLVMHLKLSLPSGLVSERKAWRLEKSERYPLGLKYRFVLADPREHRTLLLYDNHWPKGPHVHWDGRERVCEFESLEQILRDFVQESIEEERQYSENKKNRD